MGWKYILTSLVVSYILAFALVYTRIVPVLLEGPLALCEPILMEGPIEEVIYSWGDLTVMQYAILAGASLVSYFFITPFIWKLFSR